MVGVTVCPFLHRVGLQRSVQRLMIRILSFAMQRLTGPTSLLFPLTDRNGRQPIAALLPSGRKALLMGPRGSYRADIAVSRKTDHCSSASRQLWLPEISTVSLIPSTQDSGSADMSDRY